MAIRLDKLDILRSIKNMPENMMFFTIEAAAKGHLDVLKYLIDEKNAPISFDAVDHAAKNGHLAVVKYLVDKGAKIESEKNRN